MKKVVCYSGGHSSALVAVEVVRRYGPENVVLLNHDIHFTVEHADIKRFKNEVADKLSLPVTFASRRGASQDQFDVCVEAGAFKVRQGPELCTSRLKTEPFMRWLAKNDPRKGSTSFYGFDSTSREISRMQRRAGVMGALGYRTDFPLALWGDRTIFEIEELGIQRPVTYETFIHGNCIGCLKAGWQHWYIVFCTRPDIWLKAKWAEDEIGYAIHHDQNGQQFLEDWEPKFRDMQSAGVVPTERTPHQRFWADARKVVRIAAVPEVAPCQECTG